MFPRGAAEGNIEIQGKQNELSLEGVIKRRTTTATAVVVQHSRVTVHCYPLTSYILHCCPLRDFWRETVLFLDVM